MTTQLVNSLTVDELKEVIANVVDARLNSFLASLSVDITSKFSEIVRDLPKVEPNSLSREYKLYRGYASQDRKNAVISPQTNPVEDVKKENPWLTHVKKTMKENPTKKFKDILKMAKKETIISKKLLKKN